MSIPDHQIDMITAHGHVVNYAKPELTVVDPDDIRVHTRNICRYNGALYWPLVKHLALCSKLASNRVYSHVQTYKLSDDLDDVAIQAAYCAAHDFHEIYCTDVVSGLKKYLPEYKRLENIWETYVHKQLGMPIDGADEGIVRFVDLRALVIEMTCLGHPAANVVANRYGGPISGTERQIFERIEAASLDKCWEITWETFETGRNTYTSRLGYQVEVF